MVECRPNNRRFLLALALPLLFASALFACACACDRGSTGASKPEAAAGDSETGRFDAGGSVAGGVRWVGRVDTSDGAAPRFGWSGSGFVAQFSGTVVAVDLRNDDAYFFQPIIDGKKKPRFQAAKGRATRVIESGLSEGQHTLELYRETEGGFGTSQFFGITEGVLQTPPPFSGRSIEFVGDSITAGYGNLGNEPHPDYKTPSPCHFTFDTESAYESYGAITARALAADASLIAASGWGVFRSLSGDTDEVVPKVYANALGPDPGPTWDFRAAPDAVVINLGTNDFKQGDPGASYSSALSAFVDTVRSKYPKAWIFCALGTMLAAPDHDKAKSYIQSVVSAHGGDSGRLAFVDMGIQDALLGTGCDWHPSTAEDRRMADVLTPVIRQKLGW